MADYWSDPKTDWIDNDGVGYEDLNRIEANASAIRDATSRKVQGFNYRANSSLFGEDGVINVDAGSCYSTNGVPIRLNATITKNLETWVVGSGKEVGGMAPAVTVANHTWYYIFVIMNLVNGETEIMFDDNVAGANVSNGVFTEKRRVGSFKTIENGDDGGIDVAQMFSIGDQVTIDPDSMYSGGVRGNSVDQVSDQYFAVSLAVPAKGSSIPDLDVTASLSIVSSGGCAIGVRSRYGSIFAALINFVNDGEMTGEYIFDGQGLTSKTVGDCAIAVSQGLPSVWLALLFSDVPGALRTVVVAVRGYTDERFI